MTTKSDIEVSAGCTVFSGPDATKLYAARVLIRALDLYAKTGLKANRAYTPTNMLNAATRYTGKPYKRGQFDKAAADLKVWADTMYAGLSVSKS